MFDDVVQEIDSSQLDQFIDDESAGQPFLEQNCNELADSEAHSLPETVKSQKQILSLTISIQRLSFILVADIDKQEYIDPFCV